MSSRLPGTQSLLSVDRLHPHVKEVQCKLDYMDPFLVKGRREAVVVSRNFW